MNPERNSEIKIASVLTIGVIQLSLTTHISSQNNLFLEIFTWLIFGFKNQIKSEQSPIPREATYSPLERIRET